MPAHILAGMGGLVSEEGIEIQEKAYQAIIETYPNGDAAAHAFTEEGVPYIVAIYKEILRNYVVLPFSLPRQASEDIHLESGVVIPKGTRLYMNSEGGNHGMYSYGATPHPPIKSQRRNRRSHCPPFTRRSTFRPVRGQG